METNNIKYKVINTVSSYVEKLISDFRGGTIEREQYTDVLLFCAEIFDISFLKVFEDDLKNIIVNILDAIKSEIYSGKKDDLYFIGMQQSVGSIAFSLRLLNKKGMNVIQFQKYFDGLIAEYYYTHIDLYYQKPVAPIFYDSIYGLSGMLNYCLDYCLEQKEVIEGVMKYLVSLTEINDRNVIRYFIMELPRYATEETESVPYLDFGMAHGMMSPLLVLSKAREIGFRVEGIDSAIQILREHYREYELQSKEGTLKYPTQLSLEAYYSKYVDRCSFNNGWCYGNGSIVFGLMRVARACGDGKEFLYYKDNLWKIMSRDIRESGFFEPIVCHGYASVLLLQMCVYLETKEEKFLTDLETNLIATLKCHEEFLGKESYIKNYSLLEGAAGVILALLKAMGETIESSRLLLLE